MDTKQTLTMFVVAILAASVFSVVGLNTPLQMASAQTVTITTSADDHDGRFFAEGAVQVVVTDPDADDDDTQESITVDITADPATGSGDSGSFVIPETSDSSGRFEFFIMHDAADDVAVAALDAINVDGAVEYAGLTTGDAPVIRFGSGEELDIASVLFAEVDFEIEFDDASVDIFYEDTAAQVELDREQFGSTSIVHLFIVDQDANQNPTDADSFNVTEVNLNAELFELLGATFEDEVTFEETGDNTARFEATLQLTDASGGAVDDELEFDEESVQVTLNDMVYYINVALANNTLATETSDISFEVTDEDGDIDEIGTVTFGSELKVTVRDNDQNIDSEEEDTIEDALRVQANGDTVILDLEETGDNTGVFEIDLSNGELRITFLSDDDDPANNDILELEAGDMEEEILVEYVDPLDANSEEETTASFTLDLTLQAGQITAPDSAGINDEFTVTLTDPDLNDNARTRDSYTILLNQQGPYGLLRGGESLSELYTIDFELDGTALDFGNANLTIAISETGVNTGIFEFDVDMQDFTEFGANGDTLEISDGDQLDIDIEDFMADEEDADEDNVSVEIVKSSAGLDFERTTLPIPPAAGSGVAAELGTSVITNLILIDPTIANQTNVQETFPLAFDSTFEGRWIIEIEGDGFEAVIDEGDQYDDVISGLGVSLEDIMPEEPEFEETGKATGVFEAEVEFRSHASVDESDWQDMEVTFTYIDNEEDEQSAGITFRGSDGVVTVDQDSAKPGTVITITVEDQDLNLDDTEVETFEGSEAPTNPFIVSVETEDEEITNGVDNQDFEETGPDTGIFVAEYEVGVDIQVATLPSGDDQIEQATNILITYNDEVDSTGGGGDELEVNVPVVSSTGSIQITPELVGPATEITVLVIDSDLDQDADSVDDYTSTDPDGDDFFISFTSDRSEVGDASPDLEETGPNTGIFMFTIELVTDEDACEDDDLDGSQFDAEGGTTDASIGACPGDLISVRYDDEQAAGGRATTVSEVIEVSSWDPEFASDKPTYTVGERVTVTISDPDANRDADIADTLSDIRVTSDSDRVGEELSALETGRNTGVFRLSFGTTSGTAGGSISVNNGDEISIEYTDQFPADFADEEEDKEFVYRVSVGGPSGVGTTTPTAPELQDISGRTLDEVSVGQQVIITTTVVNNNSEEQPFVAIIEVRDSSDITVFLAWQTGTLTPDGRTNVGLSWTPEDSGNYELRTFVISDLQNPQVLSEVRESAVTVN